MAAKYFCDGCGDEIAKMEAHRVKRRLGDLRVEIIHAYKDTWNAGNVCHACIVKVVTDGEPDVAPTIVENSPKAA